MRNVQVFLLSTYSRVNVAITRAKCHLIILGSQQLMLSNDVWVNVLYHCLDDLMTAQNSAEHLQRLQMMQDL
ncbi:hypothetical protein BC940DRAFT_293052 [Gongronella butleri]|nr:hypothetical protein BC940DRAFT_293052 [Gongronella butleri]